MRRAAAWLAALLVASAAAVAAGAEPSADHDVPVPMRDGVVLKCDVLRPAPTGRFPTLVYRTPYGRKHAEGNEVVRKALDRGYAVVLVDVRGRYGSAGVFVPYANEGRDGYDTIEWAAAQPWSTGEIGTFGLSYPGAVQWLAAVESPPHLKAMVPAMTFSTPRNFFYAGGTWDLSWIEWIWDNIAPDARVRANLPGPRTDREASRALKELETVLPYRLPLTDVPEFRGGVAPYYFDWLAHRPGDAWWDWAEIRGKYGKTSAAVLNFSGWHDETYGPEGAITNFEGLLAARAGEKDARTRLVLGPWTHGGEDTDHSGDRSFGPTAPIDYAAMILRFMDRYVRGMDNGLDREPRVRAFVMGENTWCSGDTMPLPGTRSVSLYLGAGGTLGPREPAGSGAASSSFVSDPAHPVVDPYGYRPGAHDYRELADAQGRPRLPDRAARGAAPRRRDDRRRHVSVGRRARRGPLGAPRGRRAGRHGMEPVEPGHGRPASQRPGRRPRAEAAHPRRAGPPEAAQSPDRQPLRQGPSRAHRRVRQLHAPFFAQPADGRIGDGLGEVAPRDPAHPSRRGASLADRASGRARRGQGEAMRRIVPAALAILLSASALRGVQIQQVRIPMKDGVTLAADLWRPDEGDGAVSRAARVPAVPQDRGPRPEASTSTPTSCAAATSSRAWTSAGTGNSEGTLIPYEYSEIEQRDGEEVIAWLADQPFSNGNVGMFGISWGGFNSIHMAMRNPPALKAIIAVDATDDLYQDDVHFMDGIMHVDSWEMSQDLANAMPGAPDYVIDDDILPRALRPAALDADLQGAAARRARSGTAPR